jgi:cytochrome c oxidase subunit 4
MKVARPSRAQLGSWVALLGLLALTVTIAYQPLGAYNGRIALTIATVKALIVAAIFMELRDRRPLLLTFASAGVCWLAVLLWLASADFTRRAGYPPNLAVNPDVTARPRPRSSSKRGTMNTTMVGGADVTTLITRPLWSRSITTNLPFGR